MSDQYWRRTHEETVNDLAAVNYPSFPASFNTFVDTIFNRSFDRAIQNLPAGRALEVGCGRGRWIGRLRERGWNAAGVDIAAAAHPSAVATASALPFRGDGLDLVLAITVLQHLADKEGALDEIVRVTKPGGHILLIELIDRKGMTWQSHVMPDSEEIWRRRFAVRNLAVERNDPVEHLPLLRLVERLRSGRERSQPGRTSRASIMRSALTYASYPLEPLTRTLLPSSASHRLFLLRK